MKYINFIISGIGLFIIVTIAIIAIVDSHADNIIAAVPSSILGAALFIAGYLGMILESKK